MRDHLGSAFREKWPAANRFAPLWFGPSACAEPVALVRAGCVFLRHRAAPVSTFPSHQIVLYEAAQTVQGRGDSAERTLDGEDHSGS